MEKMRISLLSVREQHDQVVARAQAEAEQARIWIEVRFNPPLVCHPAELWQEARDQVLRYLDVL